jgi:hypothetical protein
MINAPTKNFDISIISDMVAIGVAIATNQKHG